MAFKNEEAVKNVCNSVNDFTIDFHKNVAGKNKGNLVSSGLSAHVILAMIAQGAEESTTVEMQKVLHLPHKKFARSGFQSFIDDLNNVQKVTLKLANKIYTSKNIKINDKFKEIIKTHFHSESETLDFSENEKSANEINQWCVNKTNGKINEIVQASDLDDSTKMVLLNAIYFKSNWKIKFDKDATRPQPFYVNQTTTVNVPMMHIEEKFFYQYLPELNAEIVALPYENEDLHLVIVVPKEINGLEFIEENLEKVQIDYEQYKDNQTKINLSLPKFKIESTIDLKENLVQMGMSTIFSEQANFSGISDCALKVDKALQKAFIEINEEGSEAAAVTSIIMVAYCLMPQPIVQVNKPFFYKIFYKNTALFTGHVVNPLEN